MRWAGHGNERRHLARPPRARLFRRCCGRIQSAGCRSISLSGAACAVCRRRRKAGPAAGKALGRSARAPPPRIFARRAARLRALKPRVRHLRATVDVTGGVRRASHLVTRCSRRQPRLGSGAVAPPCLPPPAQQTPVAPLLGSRALGSHQQPSTSSGISPLHASTGAPCRKRQGNRTGGRGPLCGLQHDCTRALQRQQRERTHAHVAGEASRAPDVIWVTVDDYQLRWARVVHVSGRSVSAVETYPR